MATSKVYNLKAKVFVYTVEPASWYFVSVGKKLTEEVKKVATKKVGFSFVPVEVTVGGTTWRTTLFPTKEGPYILALKKMVRQKEDIRKDDVITVKFRLV
jgi:hypothetical protein